MATVVKTIENVDSSFAEIVVNGVTYESENYVAPEEGTTTPTSSSEETSEETEEEVTEPVQGQDVKAINLNNILHNIKDEATALALSEEVTARENAITLIEGIIGQLSALETTIKTDIVSAVNEVNSKAGTAVSDIGNLQSLTTTEKSTLVGAINEVDNEADTNTQNIGTLANLNTTNKSDVVSAINEVNYNLQQIPDGIVPKGTIAFASLPSLADVEIGWMYNISDDFTTTSDFITPNVAEKAGSNVYCADAGSGTKKWDVFAVAPDIVVDQTYDGASTNPQSGTAVAGALADKMDKVNPTGTGSFSMNRASGTTVGWHSHTEGDDGTASGVVSHAEGKSCVASGANSHAEGQACTASGAGSHAEGGDATASGAYSHAEGYGTIASGIYSHTEGYNSAASSPTSHAEGALSVAGGESSHAEGYGTIASDYQHAQGKYNVDDSNNTYADIVGNGSDGDNRKNIEATTWTGDKRIAGDYYFGCNDDSSGGTSVSGALASKVNTSDVSSSVTSGDTNPVSGDAVYTALSNISGRKVYTVTATVSGIVNITDADVTALTEGMQITIMTTSIFSVTSSYASTGVKLRWNSDSSLDKNIRYIKNGARNNLTAHTGNFGGSSSTTYRVWDAYTTINLVYDGTYWIIIGNPTLCSYTTISSSLSANSYEIKANGLIRQWGYYDSGTEALEVTKDITFSVQFSSTNSYSITHIPYNSTTTTHYCMGIGSKGKSATGITLSNYSRDANYDKSTGFQWIAEGY